MSKRRHTLLILKQTNLLYTPLPSPTSGKNKKTSLPFFGTPLSQAAKSSVDLFEFAALKTYYYTRSIPSHMAESKATSPLVCVLVDVDVAPDCAAVQSLYVGLSVRSRLPGAGGSCWLEQYPLMPPSVMPLFTVCDTPLPNARHTPSLSPLHPPRSLPSSSPPPPLPRPLSQALSVTYETIAMSTFGSEAPLQRVADLGAVVVVAVAAEPAGLAARAGVKLPVPVIAVSSAEGAGSTSGASGASGASLAQAEASGFAAACSGRAGALAAGKIVGLLSPEVRSLVNLQQSRYEGSAIVTEAQLKSHQHARLIAGSMSNCVTSTDLEPVFRGLQQDLGEGAVIKYVGKVRDRYELPHCVVLVTTDRQSAFDRNLAAVPYKVREVSS